MRTPELGTSRKSQNQAIFAALATVALFCLLMSSCGGGGGVSNSPPTPTITSVSVTCSPTSIQTAQTSQCTATVTGTGSYSSAVTWSASAGTINSSGLFTAPSAAGTVTVTATSTQDGSKSGTATITVTLPPTITSVSVTCNPSSVQIGQTSQCTATVQGTGAFDNAVHWLVNDVEGGNTAVGTISTSGFYTAPASVPLPNLLTVEAISVANPSKSGAAAMVIQDVPFRAGGSFLDTLEVESITREDGTVVEAAKDEVLIYLSEDVTGGELSAVASRIQSLGAIVLGSSLDLRVIQVRVPTEMMETDFISQIRSSPGVVTAGLNEALPLAQANSNKNEKLARVFGRLVAPRVSPSLVLPTTPCTDFPGCYWIDHIEARNAWAISKGSLIDDAIVGVVDTGISAEQSVVAESRLERYDTKGNPLSDDTSKNQSHHGLWVTAFAGGSMDNPVVMGVAQKNRIISIDAYGVLSFIPILDRIFKAQVLEGIKTGIQEGARIINVSTGFNDCDSTHEERIRDRELFRDQLTPAIDLAKRNDRLIVFAASNGCEKHDDVLLPDDSKWPLDNADAWRTNAIRVAATNRSTLESPASPREEAGFSDMGEVVDLAAPGDSIGWGGSTGSGTSFAAPLVTGTAALMRSASPTLSAPEIKQILLSTAEPLDIDNKPKLLLNAHRALIDASATIGVPFEVLPEVSLSSGETKKVSFSVTLPTATVSSMDVLFLIDTTSSYGDDIDTLQSRAMEILNNLSSRGIDVQFGVASFADFPFSPYGDPSYGDQAFYLNQPITNNLEAVQAAISQLDNPLHYGGDIPESQLEALYQAATGSGLDLNSDGDYSDLGDLAPANIGWRTGSLKVVILATDAPFHNPELEAYFGPTFGEVIDALNAKGIAVIGLDSGSAGPDLSRVVDATGGALFELSSGSSEIADRIYQGITGHLQQVTLSVERVSGQEWVPSVDPSSFSNVQAGESRTFTVTLEGKKRNGVTVQNYNVFLWVRADNSAIEKRVRIPIVVPSE